MSFFVLILEGCYLW